MSQNWTKEQYRDHIARRLKQEQHEQSNSAVGALQNSERKHDPASSLAGSAQGSKGRKTGVRLRIAIISCRRRRVDPDNLVAGAKWIVDSIARRLQINDGDDRIEWSYGQQIIGGQEGVLVMIERV